MKPIYTNRSESIKIYIFAGLVLIEWAEVELAFHKGEYNKFFESNFRKWIAHSHSVNWRQYDKILDLVRNNL